MGKQTISSAGFQAEPCFWWLNYLAQPGKLAQLIVFLPTSQKVRPLVSTWFFKGTNFKDFQVCNSVSLKKISQIEVAAFILASKCLLEVPIWRLAFLLPVAFSRNLWRREKKTDWGNLKIFLEAKPESISWTISSFSSSSSSSLESSGVLVVSFLWIGLFLMPKILYSQ